MPNKGTRIITAALTIAAVAAFLVGCGGDPGPVDPEANKLLVIGIDSADWRLLDPMLAEGRLPALRSFMAEAAYGRMKTFYPLEKSPLLWASISTGVLPEVHGVNHFVEGEEQQPVLGSSWFAPAIWDIVGAAGRTSAVIGMWTTYPARPIAGVMVSDYLPYGVSRDKPLANLVYPDSLAEAILSLRVDPSSLTAEDLGRFVPGDRLAAAEAAYPKEMLQLRTTYAADLSYLAVSRFLAERMDPDLFFFYQRGPDMISHHFYKYHVAEAESERIDPEEAALFKGVVTSYYDWSDEVMAEVLSWFPSDRQCVVLSDHGFYGPRRGGAKGTAEHSEWGIFLVRSPLYRPGFKFGHIELLDICPTFLALMGLPAAADMPGVVLDQGTTAEGARRIARLEQHRVESYQGLRPADGPEGERDPGVDEEIRRQLRSLGYIN